MEIWGIVLILLSGAGAVFSLLGSLENKVRCVKALVELTVYVKSSVENYSMSVSEILRGCDRALLTRIGYPEGADIPRSLVELLEGSDITDDAARGAFCELAVDFGRNYRQQQTRQCELCIDALRKRAAELEAALPARRKMIISVCASAALILVILLL